MRNFTVEHNSCRPLPLPSSPSARRYHSSYRISLLALALRRDRRDD
jgi:hypothetical protein